MRMFPSFGWKKDQTINERCNWEKREMLTFVAGTSGCISSHLSLSYLGSINFAQLKMVVHILHKHNGAAASGLVAERRYESV